MYATSRIARTGLKTASVSGSTSYRTLFQAAASASGPTQASELSSKRRRISDQAADPHTSVFGSQQPIETRTIKTSQEAAASPPEPKSLDRFGFKAIKDQLKNYVAGPLYAH